MEAEHQFRHRILLVDNEVDSIRSCSALLRKEGYEVLTGNDGFGALCRLRGSHPDMLITELNLPHMSGFELLSIVRTRFPGLAVIAISGDYTPATVPHDAVCDAFIAKTPNLKFELLEQTRKLISESPIRGSRAKSDLAPLWVPRSKTGYIVLTCPECLRSFSAVEPRNAGVTNETCLCCGADVAFELSSVEAPPTPPLPSRLVRSQRVREKSRHLVTESEKLRRRPRF